MLRIDANSDRKIQALLLGIRQANREVQREIRQRTKPMLESEWRRTLAQEAMTRMEHRVLVETSRVQVSNQNVKLKSAGLKRRLRGGLVPVWHWRSVELGTDPDRTHTYQSRRGNTKFTVHDRHTTRQFSPRMKGGRVVYPSAAQIIPRLAALWTQTTVRTFYEALEKGTTNG